MNTSSRSAPRGGGGATASGRDRPDKTAEDVGPSRQPLGRPVRFRCFLRNTIYDVCKVRDLHLLRPSDDPPSSPVTLT